MKQILWVVGGLCAAAAGCLLLGIRRDDPINELAHKLEVGWAAEHHTVV